MKDSLIQRLTMELNRLSKGKGVADDGGGSGGGIAASGTSEDEEIYAEFGAGNNPKIPS